MRPEKIARFARNMRELGQPLRVEIKGHSKDRCGTVMEVSSEVLTLENGREMEWIPLEQVRWIGIDFQEAA